MHSCSETITKVGGGQASHTCEYNYDMLSRLNYAKITDIATKPYMEWINTYDDAGNMTDFIYNEGSGDESVTYSFDGDLVTGDNAGNLVNRDDNGRQTSQLNAVPEDYSLEYDWDGRLRQAGLGNANRNIQAKYTPTGVRVTKKKIWDGATVYNHKYIVDVSGKVPAILLVLDANNSNAILKTYIHANGQVLAQHDGDHTAARYFYLHDRLGSVRQIIDDEGAVVNHYTYDPWGLPIDGETTETVSNMYRFANYVWDSEISMYYCIARMYDPVLGRFTSRDPVAGNYQEPMTLHKYLYCLNNSINKTDPTGEIAIPGIVTEVAELYEARNVAISSVVSSASDAWEMAEGLTSVQNTVAATVEARGLADRAFGAIGCIGQARSKAMRSLMNCVPEGITWQMLASGGSIVCLAAGPAAPACFAAYGIITTTALASSDIGCMMEAVGTYSQSLYECTK